MYVARNPKDVIVSYYHYHRLMNFHGFAKDLDTFADYFLKDQLWCTPYFPHLLQAWKKRHHPNMLFLFYEDLKRVKHSPSYKSLLETIVEFHCRFHRRVGRCFSTISKVLRWTRKTGP